MRSTSWPGAPSGALRYDGFVQLENGIGMVRSLLDDWRKARQTDLAAGLPGPSPPSWPAPP